MKIILISVIMIVMCHLNGNSQNVYLILTSQTTPLGIDLNEGIRESNYVGNDPIYKSPPIYYNLVSKSKMIWELFCHIDFNPTELSKIRPVEPDDQMEILREPLAILNTITLIDLDVLFPTWTKTQADAFGQSMLGKKIYIIDRRSINRGTIEMIQVKYCKALSF